MLSTCLPSGIWILEYARESPKTLGPKAQARLLMDNTSHMLLQLVTGGIEYVLCDPQQLVSGSLCTSAHASVPLLILRCVLCCNLSCWHDYLWSPVNPGGSSDLGVALGTH